VLPGDANQSGGVDIVDVSAILGSLFSSPTRGPYTEFGDITANGVIDIVDVSTVLGSLFTMLPLTFPGTLGGSSASSMIVSGFVSDVEDAEEDEESLLMDDLVFHSASVEATDDSMLDDVIAGSSAGSYSDLLDDVIDELTDELLA
jgi:hypothetical protein